MLRKKKKQHLYLHKRGPASMKRFEKLKPDFLFFVYSTLEWFIYGWKHVLALLHHSNSKGIPSPSASSPLQTRNRKERIGYQEVNTTADETFVNTQTLNLNIIVGFHAWFWETWRRLKNLHLSLALSPHPTHTHSNPSPTDTHQH